MMFKPPKFMEYNNAPSQLNTQLVTGAAAQMASVAENKPSYDGVTIEQMRGNPLYSHADDIDKVTLAQQKVVDAGNKIKSKSKVIRAMNDAAQKYRKPNS